MTVNFQQIPYGGGYLDYAFGKEGVELVYSKGLILDNEIAPDITDEGIMDQIRLFQASMGKHPKNAIFSAEISPTPEESKDWTNEDFRNIALELLTTMDSPGLKDKHGKPFAKRTTLMNSMCAIVKHVDSKSGIVHLHAMISTIDLEGKAIPQHKIAERAVAACDIVNANHHWKQPKDIRKEHLAVINANIENILLAMKKWDWNTFKSRLESCGYVIKEKADGKGKIVNYTLYRGNSKFKASDLGKDNCYTAAHLEATWKSLHSESKIKGNAMPDNHQSQNSYPVADRIQYEESYLDRCGNNNDEDYVDRTITIGNYTQTIYVPQDIYDIFDEDCYVPQDNRKATNDDVVNAAIHLFLGYVDAATTYIESHGGGNAPTDDWGGKRDEEDDWMFAHRCARAVTSRMKPKLSRGLHK